MYDLSNVTPVVVSTTDSGVDHSHPAVDLTGYATTAELAGYATSEDLTGFATTAELAGYVTHDGTLTHLTKKTAAEMAALTEDPATLYAVVS